MRLVCDVSCLRLHQLCLVEDDPVEGHGNGGGEHSLIIRRRIECGKEAGVVG